MDKVLDVEKFGVIYAGAQKNIGPAGTAGGVTLTFASNAWYRAGLAGGLALLPLLLVLALLPARRPVLDTPVSPWAPRWSAVAAAVAAGALISGVTGAVVFAAALAVRYVLRGRPGWQRATTLALVPGGLILAGSVLSRYPWRSVDGYVGHSAGVQLLALISLAALTASVCIPPAESDESAESTRTLPPVGTFERHDAGADGAGGDRRR